MSRETVVLVHGLWMPGIDMLLLQKRLQRRDFQVQRYSYPSLRRAPRENAAQLAKFTETLDAPVVHFVGHSLGGLVIRHLFDSFPQHRPGRIVTLGTPHKPSHTAQLLYRAALLPLLGMSIEQGLIGGAPSWNGSHALGSIAGNLPIGFGRLIPGLAKPNDGTVAVAETECPGMTDHVTVTATHTGLLFSAAAAEQTAVFLRDGRFRH
ncbi:MAG: alpha/beta fold hydrolase [Gammaproteobacteria bacterium]